MAWAFGLMELGKGPRGLKPRNRGVKVPLILKVFQEVHMDNSVFQARWLLIPIVGLCVFLATLGALAA